MLNEQGAPWSCPVRGIITRFIDIYRFIFANTQKITMHENIIPIQLFQKAIHGDANLKGIICVEYTTNVN
jgi:hypothetical protein